MVIWLFLIHVLCPTRLYSYHFFARHFAGSRAIKVNKIKENLCPRGVYIVVRGVLHNSYLSIEYSLLGILSDTEGTQIFLRNWLASKWKHYIPHSVITVLEAIVQLGNKPYTVILISPLAFFSCKMPVLDYQTICKVWAPGSSGLMALMCSKILIILYSDFDTPYILQWLTLNYFQIIL